MILRSVAVLLLVLSVVLTWAWQDYQAFITRPMVAQESVIMEVAKGSSFRSIILQLDSQTGLQQADIDKLWFEILARQLGLITQLKAGEYLLPVGQTPTEFLLLLGSGITRQHSITFPEGWTFKQIRQMLSADKNLKLTLAGISDSEIMQKIGSPYTHPEGLFFPDTYRFEKSTTDVAILQRAYQKMQQVLLQQWQNKEDGLPIKISYEALILASIVEKETAVPSERPAIAGVFTRRLNKGMRLQTDPTVIYGMGESYQGNIRKKDLQTLTPYNTYKINGLPPTPIAMPGVEAINAVLHPAKGNSLYFVANGDGSHNFSATLSEHNRAVQAYLRKR
ncbi:MAG: endolytic transglycosylase MltG [Gammaproteobacteria bacterium]|nr:endolytic transglycosylase MltG [Gammaproteobacteria bacterium]MBT5221825.1 endolytic transglycosylase MltG [Gammaproteobacteria bacterium]MBT5824817.1 endolytic transglycosylase MltG [Gammaproteobacteria bacterium]MBT5967652.1 endolytic transglycosylase MltG [Gammaproteobacteria bacterium]